MEKKKVVTKLELATRSAKRLTLSIPEVLEVCTILFDEFRKALEAKEQISIRKVGTWKPVIMKASKAYNFAKKETMDIPAIEKYKFTQSKPR